MTSGAPFWGQETAEGLRQRWDHSPESGYLGLEFGPNYNFLNKKLFFSIMNYLRVTGSHVLLFNEKQSQIYL